MKANTLLKRAKATLSREEKAPPVRAGQVVHTNIKSHSPAPRAVNQASSGLIKTTRRHRLAAASNTLAIKIISAAPTTHKGTLSSTRLRLIGFHVSSRCRCCPALLIQLAAQQWRRCDKERTQRMVANARCLTNARNLPRRGSVVAACHTHTSLDEAYAFTWVRSGYVGREPVWPFPFALRGRRDTDWGFERRVLLRPRRSLLVMGGSERWRV